MIKRLVLIVVIVYVVLLGGTYNGILDPGERLLSLIGLIGLGLIWGWAHWRGRWQWQRTPLDWAILLWIVAFTLSLITNLDSWRRIALGLWYMGVYVGVWYALHDAFANSALKREWLIDGLLIAGVPVLFVGFAQVEVALTSGLALPRPVGTLGNANALGALLVVLLPLIAGRLKRARRPLTRMSLLIYGLGALALLALSFSRGGWIGGAVALAVWAVLSLPLLKWWQRLTRAQRSGLIFIAFMGALVGAYVLIDSFGIGGRGLDLRTWIYETALHLFGERPLSGTGLFTFGAGLSRLNSLPPLEPHSHAHNIILHVAAELGIVGLAALALTSWIILKKARRPSDPTAIMGLAAFAGFAAHQLFDVPAMMPTIALLALAALVLALPATMPAKPSRQLSAVVALGALGVLVLALSGVWSALNYRAYVAALSDGISSGDYRAAADRLLPIIQSDPALALTYEQRGMLLGLAAASGDQQAVLDGVNSFQRYVALEPSYASGWANLGALDEQAGSLRAAMESMSQAAQLAPQSWSLAYAAGVYAEAAGNDAAASDFYQKAFKLNSNVVLIPGWDTSALRRAVHTSDVIDSVFAQAVLRLEAGDVAGAKQLWTTVSGSLSNYYVVTALLAQIDGDLARAQVALKTAQNVMFSPSDHAWVLLGSGLLGQIPLDQALTQVDSILNSAPTGSDWALGANIDYIQYLALAMPRKFLPQVGYSELDLLLVHLLNDGDGLARLQSLAQHGAS